MTSDPNLVKSHVDSSRINESLAQILRSARFKGSMQLQTLLKYVVEESLRGHDEVLKERIIGIEVFRRKPDYDTADDPIVRSRIGLLRKRLGEYYESDEGRTSAIHIVIPHGSYRPEFVLRPELSDVGTESPAESKISGAPQTVQEDPVPETVSLASKSPKRVLSHLWVIGAAVSGLVLLAVWLTVANQGKSELYLFWKPILDSNKTVLLYNGSISLVYLSNRTRPPSAQELPASMPFVPSPDEQPLAVSDFVPYKDGLVPPGDITADLRVGAVMNKYSRAISLRSGPNLLFVDLKGSPAILIGAYDNYWTLDLGRNLPFFFDNGIKIREQGGQHRVWSSIARADNTIADDYAIVFRLLDSKTGAPVVAIAGLTTCGTQAAAEFVTDPVQLRKLASIPRDALERKNLEFVLHASLLNCTPISVNVVAQQVW